mgnify:CR=1 FL=1
MRINLKLTRQEILTHLVMIIAVILDLFYGSHGLGVLAYVWGTIPASSTASFQFTSIPQFIEFTVTTVPTSFQIEINGDGFLFNLDGAGLNNMTHIRHLNRVANTYIFQLGDGLILGKQGTVTIANAFAGTLTINAISPVKMGTTYFVYARVAVLAGATVQMKNFSYAAFPSAATTDRFTIAYKDGSVDNVGREEVNVFLTSTQGSVITSAYNIDNISPARIDNLQFTGTAAQTGYAQRYVPARGAKINADFDENQ